MTNRTQAKPDIIDVRRGEMVDTDITLGRVEGFDALHNFQCPTCGSRDTGVSLMCDDDNHYDYCLNCRSTWRVEFIYAESKSMTWEQVFSSLEDLPDIEIQIIPDSWVELEYIQPYRLTEGGKMQFLENGFWVQAAGQTYLFNRDQVVTFRELG